MRFKKLKIVVGIAIILFILMVANTIAFGILYEKPLAQIDNKTGTLKLIEIPAENASVANKNTSTTAAKPVETPVVKTVLPPVDTTTAPVKQVRRTRAS
jgi:hypothetical protein